MNGGYGLVGILAAGLLLSGCGKNTSTAPPPEGPGAVAPAVTGAPVTGAPVTQASGGNGAVASVGGLKWQAPEGWSVQPPRPMRAATYTVPASAGDPESGEIAVFYFGPNEGGGVQANIDRWVGQMKQPDGSSSATKAKVEKIQGVVPVTMLDLTGTYLSSSGPMMQVSAEKPGFRMMGAIIEGTQGAVFFKFTGPGKTVDDNAARFLEMVKEVARE